MRSWFSLQFPGPRVPIRHEAEDVLLRRLWRKRFQPAHRLAADVAEGVHAPHTGPDDIPGTEMVGRAVEGRLDLTAENEIGLLERVIVQADADTRLILDEQHAVMA